MSFEHCSCTITAFYTNPLPWTPEVFDDRAVAGSDMNIMAIVAVFSLIPGFIEISA